MITLGLVWFSGHYKMKFEGLYFGTCVIDIVGIAGTVGVVRTLLA